MFEIVVIVGSIWGYRRIKRYLAEMKTTSSSNFNTHGDTVTIQEFEEVDEDLGAESDEVQDNIEELRELKETIKKSIKYQIKNENLQEVKNLLSYLEEIRDKIEELEKADRSKFLAVKAKAISRRIINKLDDYI